ncbi:DMT family transporter [Geomonas oryzisoli]|uniref:DMT family transporter n=1 Tax=Geomonas oryzisoli TaxID=2847992 RepID=UPI001EEFAD5C|nr:DMT family transporter [Geomonas oryzisoli]
MKDAISKVDVFIFLAQRFLIAAAIMLPIALTRVDRIKIRLFTHASILGILLFASYAFQTVALKYTSASNTGFLTGLSVLLVPLFGAAIFRHAVAPGIKWGVGLATPGLFLLCTDGSLNFNVGDILGAICGACVALHLLYTSHFARHADSDVYLLTTLQLSVVGLLSLVSAEARGQEVFVWHPELLWTLVVCVLIATIFAFLVQTTMQKWISPAHTALIFCTEPVFAAVYAYYAAGERLGALSLLGAVLILAGMVVSELLPDGADSEATVTVAAEG